MRAHAAAARADLAAAKAQAGRTDPIDKLARLGLLAEALLYGLIGLLAIQIAGGGSEEADQQGALQQVAEQPLGKVVLWLMVAGFAGYALWRFSEAAWGRRDEDDERKRTLKRIGSAASGVVVLGLGFLALRTVTGGGSSGGGGTSTTAKVLEWPAGEVLVVIAGLVVIAVAIGLTIRGLRTDFEENLDTGKMGRTTFSAVRRLGQVGYAARGVAIGLAGVFVVKAAFENDPDKAEGLDVALKSLAGGGLGSGLLYVVAAGLLCFAAYGIAQARYRRLETPTS